MPPDEAERFVGTGSFRVDREKALAKLERYQLEDPWDFAAAWARLAVESGSSRVEASTEEGGSVLVFDGKTLPERLLIDPVSALFGEEDDGRGRLLAVGLLGVLKLRPASVEIRSAGRSWLHDATEGDRTKRVETAEGTRVSIAWGAGAALEARNRFVGEFKAVLALADVELTVDGVSLGRKHALHDPLTKVVRLSGGRTLAARRGGNVYVGTLSLYHRGVRAYRQTETAIPEIEVHVSDDSLRLDFTGCRVSWDRRLGDTVEEAVSSALSLLPPPPGGAFLAARIPPAVSISLIVAATLAAAWLVR